MATASLREAPRTRARQIPGSSDPELARIIAHRRMQRAEPKTEPLSKFPPLIYANRADLFNGVRFRLWTSQFFRIELVDATNEQLARLAEAVAHECIQFARAIVSFDTDTEAAARLAENRGAR